MEAIVLLHLSGTNDKEKKKSMCSVQMLFFPLRNTFSLWLVELTAAEFMNTEC